MLSGRRRCRKHGRYESNGANGGAAMTRLSIAPQTAAARWRIATRVAYIGGVTILTCAFLLEGIFVRILLIPYLHEAAFAPTQCILHNTFYHYRAGLQRCESRCAKLASSFPCLVVRVNFLNQEDQTWHTGYLFDQLKTFQKRQPFFVSRHFVFLQDIFSFRIYMPKWNIFPFLEAIVLFS